MSEAMKMSICKSAAYGETAEKTAEMHHCTVEEVKQIWESKKDIILAYQNFQKEMGCSH